MDTRTDDVISIEARIRSVIEDYHRRWHDDPGGMLLDGKTYLELCQEISYKRGAPGILQPSEVHGLPITIAPVESRVVIALHGGSTFDQAVRCTKNRFPLHPGLSSRG